ncbi:MAG TPA: 50S ribosomal protein L1 [Chloroflexi bacterium]|jgi:large subunit ribosomal protein L1|nr:50S ribosomal protein L1 [Chloroflexota bacterium]HBY46176.1 50S ribosomal protein L1 [Chloroflexota bacterium]HRA33046.1 50S ribosomal protein L1 [Thermomicrobiales bacterium]
MPKRGKKYQAAVKLLEPEREYEVKDAVELLKKMSYVGFDETVEMHFRLGIDPRQADQAVRSTVILPAGTGKVTRVLVFAVGDAARIAQEAGADYVGSDDLVKQINDGWLEFDSAIAMADQMGKVGGLGRILGRRGLMPNPRSGTVVRTPEDLPGVIRELKGGRVEFRNDRTGLVHVAIGKLSFSEDRLVENANALIDAIQRHKPQAAKGIYLRTITLTSTMTPGIPLDVAATVASAAQAG